jgi:hypothetical protein
MTFKAGEQAYIIENHSRVTPVVVVRSYGDFYTVAFGEKNLPFTYRCSEIGSIRGVDRGLTKE